MGSPILRRKYIYLAKLAEEVERYDDMVFYMKQVAEFDLGLTTEEMILLSVGYKKLFSALRLSRLKLFALEESEKSKGNENNVKMVKLCIRNVEEKLERVCLDNLKVINQHLIPTSTSSESTVFYDKMKGDTYRYLAEFKTGQDRKDAVEQAFKAYELAWSRASTELPWANAIRLALALNFSVFHYEILDSRKKAYDLAKTAYEKGLLEITDLRDETCKYSTLSLSLLKDNLVIWKSDLFQEGEDSDLNVEEPQAKRSRTSDEYPSILND